MCSPYLSVTKCSPRSSMEGPPPRSFTCSGRSASHCLGQQLLQFKFAWSDCWVWCKPRANLKRTWVANGGRPCVNHVQTRCKSCVNMCKPDVNILQTVCKRECLPLLRSSIKLNVCMYVQTVCKPEPVTITPTSCLGCRKGFEASPLASQLLGPLCPLLGQSFQL
jgi:hypothetical protein